MPFSETLWTWTLQQTSWSCWCSWSARQSQLKTLLFERVFDRVKILKLWISAPSGVLSCVTQVLGWCSLVYSCSQHDSLGLCRHGTPRISKWRQHHSLVWCGKGKHRFINDRGVLSSFGLWASTCWERIAQRVLRIFPFWAESKTFSLDNVQLVIQSFRRRFNECFLSTQEGTAL